MTMRVDWVIACQDAVKRSDRMVDMVGAGVDHIKVSSFPSRVKLTLAARFIGTFEQGKLYNFSVSILDPQLNECNEPLVGIIEPSPLEPDDPSDWEAADLIAVDAFFTAKTHGIYTVSAWTDANPYHLRLNLIHDTDATLAD